MTDPIATVRSFLVEKSEMSLSVVRVRVVFFFVDIANCLQIKCIVLIILCGHHKYFHYTATVWICIYVLFYIIYKFMWCRRVRRGHDRMVVGFTTTYAMSAYHN